MSFRDASEDELPVATGKENVSKTVAARGEGTATHSTITSSAFEPCKPSESVESPSTASHEVPFMKQRNTPQQSSASSLGLWNAPKQGSMGSPSLWNTPQQGSMGSLSLWNTPQQGSMCSLSLWNTPQQGSMGSLSVWSTPQQGSMSQWTLPQLAPMSHCNLSQQAFMGQWNPPQEASTSQWNQASINQWIPPHQTSYMNQWDPVQQKSAPLWIPNLSATIRPVIGPSQSSLSSSNELIPSLEETSNSFSKLSIGPSSTASTSTVASLPLPSSVSSGSRSPPKPFEGQHKSASSLRGNPPLRWRSKTNYRGRPGGWENRSNIYCPFCRQNGEEDYFHAMTNELKEVTCPVLWAYRCRLCGATGPKAHTLKYCPLNPYTRGDPVAAGLRPGLTPPHLDPFR
ncbi:uncharacterized protein [Macrobrachium rosenbergii]|uniref:uncharacterized protein isoform X2 n=1 Tax=Macrobrachium rosenbergii TaxID=79674 RepID=UPI0034D3D4D0